MDHSTPRRETGSAASEDVRTEDGELSTIPASFVYLLGVNFTPFPQITERRLVQTTDPSPSLLASSFVFS